MSSREKMTNVALLPQGMNCATERTIPRAERKPHKAERQPEVAGRPGQGWGRRPTQPPPRCRSSKLQKSQFICDGQASPLGELCLAQGLMT